jgi:hypothetical protein
MTGIAVPRHSSSEDVDHWSPVTRPSSRPAGPADVFRSKLPVTARIVDLRWWLLPVASLLSLVLGMLTRSASLGWSPMLAWAILPAIAADRPFHALSVIGPTTLAAFVLFLKFGVGLPLAESAGMEVAGAAAFECGCFALTVICTLLFLLRLIGPSDRRDAPIAEQIRLSQKDLGHVGLLMLVYALVLDVVLVITGGLDRSLSSEKAYGYGEMGWWSWFALFQDITNMGLFLLPLAMRRWMPWSKLMLYAVVFARSGVYMLSGTRSGALFPLFFLALGYVAFTERLPKWFEIYALLIAICAYPLIDFTDYLRNSDFFHETKVTDIGGRLGAAGKALTTLREEDESRRAESTLVTGKALLEFSDPIIYERTPNPNPYAGFGDLHNLAYVFIPRYFMPTKPILLDGNEIVVAYTGVRQIGTAAGVSLNADLYRRGGVPAVIVGGVFSAILVILYMRLSLATMRSIDPAFGLLMLVMLVIMGFRHPLFHWTVLSLGSYYLYSFPKFLFFLAFLLGASRLLFGSSRPRTRLVPAAI